MSTQIELIGGSGEKKTLRLMAPHAEIEKTVQTRFDLGEHGERVDQTIEHLHELAALGIQVAHGTLIGVGSLRPLELMAERVIPAIEKF
jgi:hypothetical protein